MLNLSDASSMHLGEKPLPQNNYVSGERYDAIHIHFNSN